MNRSQVTIQTYDKIARDYEEENYKFEGENEINAFTKLLKPNSRILDAGCGFGRELLSFSKLGFETYGIDASEELLKLAKKRAPKASVFKANLEEKLPFDGNFFDGVWTRNSLHHVEPEKLNFTLSEIKRVLKKDGIFYVEWKEGEKPTMTYEEIANGNPRFYNLMNEAKLIEILEKAGFTIKKSYTYNWSQRYGKKRQFSNFIAAFATK